MLLWNSTQPLRKNKIIPLAGTQMELEIVILSEVSQGKIDTIWYHVWNLKYDTNEFIYETDSQT